MPPSSPSTRQLPRPAPQTGTAQPTATRRRGAALEQALLKAAWDQLKDEGLEGFTFDAVAERAATSKSVIYRRWRTREELIRAMVRALGEQIPRPVPDTGSLRGDLIAVLNLASAEHAEMIPILSLSLASHYGGLKLSFDDFRKEFIGDRGLRTTTILERAAARGEVDLARVTPRLAALPFDLFRNEFLTTLKPVPPAVIEEIVDQVVLPLLPVPGAGPAGPAPGHTTPEDPT